MPPSEKATDTESELEPLLYMDRTQKTAKKQTNVRYSHLLVVHLGLKTSVQFQELKLGGKDIFPGPCAVTNYHRKFKGGWWQGELVVH